MKHTTENENRSNSVEILRIISAFAIIWYHSGIEGHNTSYFGLAVFIIITFSFIFGKNINEPVSAKKLALRLLLPWILWWPIFIIFNYIRCRPIFNFESSIFGSLITGPSLHLWYLPFMFFTSIVFGKIKNLYSQETLAFCTMIATIIILTTTPLWRPSSLAWQVPWAQYTHALALVALGILLGLACHGWFQRVCLGIAIFALIIGPSMSYDGVGIPYLIGTVLVILALYFARSELLNKIKLRTIPKTMLGVYLVHPIALSAARPITDRAAFLGVMTAFILSLIFVIFIKQLLPRASKYIVGQ